MDLLHIPQSQNMLVEERKLRCVFEKFISNTGKIPLEGEESPVISLEVFVPSLLQTWIRKLYLADTVLLLCPH